MSSNRKLATRKQVSVTMAAQASCPPDCPFFKKGCYAERGPQGMITSKLNKSPITDPVGIAEHEAKQIGRLSGVFDLRLHVVGDARTDQAAMILAHASAEYRTKHNRPVWTYTHAHDVDRNSWGPVSVLRSCESMEQVKKAHQDNYAAALVVAEFESEKAYPLEDGYVGIPCPQMTGKAASCAECGLCKKDRLLHSSKRVILFAAHGSGKKRVIEMLKLV